MKEEGVREVERYMDGLLEKKKKSRSSRWPGCALPGGGTAHTPLLVFRLECNVQLKHLVF